VHLDLAVLLRTRWIAEVVDAGRGKEGKVVAAWQEEEEKEELGEWNEE
jgi:hypothetical protein